MLKIGKGLKKKKKNKKGKGKDQELFTEEELEQYRREHSQKPSEEAGTCEVGESSNAGSEEFEKFKLLTAGVDDILKKTQGDLDRIKKESFFQRKPTPSEIKAQEEKEKAELEKTEGGWVDFGDNKGEVSKAVESNEISHLEEESESDFEDNDDIFDTAYVDVLESGQVKLVYVPDEDELETDDGPDPFDTSTADELLRKAEEEEKRKKKEISLGLAVNVLTGRAERDKALLEDTDPTREDSLKKTRVRPRKIQDLCLLGSFDDSSKAAPVQQTDGPTGQEVSKSLLDEDVAIEGELPEGDVLITEVLVKQVAKPLPPEFLTPTDTEDDKVVEVDFIEPRVDLEIRKLEEEDEFDEFSALAASSVANQKLEEELQQYTAAEDDPFDTSVIDVVLRNEPDPFESIEGQVNQPVEIPITSTPWPAFPESPIEVDPFDTTFASDCAPGKAELRLLEKEILNTTVVPPVARKIDIHLEARILSRNNSEDFNPRDGENQSAASRVSIHITNPSGETQRGSESEEIVSLNLSHRDLLGGSTTDLTSLGDQPLPPNTASPTEEISRYSDPFDTSVAEQVAAPGRAELKFIESELLSDIRDTIDEDDDFDPRADDPKSVPRGVSFDIPSPNLLTSDREDGVGARPLTPYYAEPTSAESDLEAELDDPFDTSHVSSLPGKQELKLIEEELEKSQTQPPIFQPIHEKLGILPEATEGGGLKHSISDQDFNPRGDDAQLKIVQPTPVRRFSDISGLHNPPESLPLRRKLTEDKPDLLAVEEELADKALTPAAEEDISGYVDPFDTSIAENIAPGKAELRVLELELVSSISRSYSDPDFNPRDPPASEGKLKTVPSTKPLAPIELSEVNEEIDPFDTSIANNLGPGRAELRLLESELVG